MTGAPSTHAASRIDLSGEDGMSMIEVIVATVVLVVGVLGLIPILTNSLASTSRTTAREQGTNVARDLLERARQVPYAMTTTPLAPAALAATLPENPPVSGRSFTVRRRNVSYTVTVTACSIDDPSDGAGLGDATFCDPKNLNPIPPIGGTSSGLAVGPNVLGVAVAAGGTALQTVCNAAGTDSAILNAVGGTASNVLSLASSGAQVSACPSGAAGQVGFDPKPDDLRRIRIDMTWNADGRAGQLRQSTLLTTPPAL